MKPNHSILLILLLIISLLSFILYLAIRYFRASRNAVLDVIAYEDTMDYYNSTDCCSSCSFTNCSATETGNVLQPDHTVQMEPTLFKVKPSTR